MSSGNGLRAHVTHAEHRCPSQRTSFRRPTAAPAWRTVQACGQVQASAEGGTCGGGRGLPEVGLLHGVEGGDALLGVVVEELLEEVERLGMLLQLFN